MRRRSRRGRFPRTELRPAGRRRNGNSLEAELNLLKFSKMNGAGNDFVVVDCSEAAFVFTAESIRKICDRRRGIGADGLILLSRSRIPGCGQVVMEFFNCDGSKAELCGNGLRCAALFAHERGLSREPSITFTTGGGELAAEVISDGMVRIELPVTETFEKREHVGGFTVFKGAVGVPHAVVRMDSLDAADILRPGRALRFHEAFAPAGVNVDFVEFGHDFTEPVTIRTYERGVEDETLACGTGIASCARVLADFFQAPSELTFRTRSGDLVRTRLPDGENARIVLTGPAVEVYRGTAPADRFELASVTAADSPYSKEKESKS